MPIHFLITKAFPVLAILLIYWIGSFNLPSVIFLPIAIGIAAIVFYITRKYGDKKDNTTQDSSKNDQ